MLPAGSAIPGPATSRYAPGSLCGAKLPTDVYSAARGYGWQQNSLLAWDRATGDNLLRDFHC